MRSEINQNNFRPVQGKSYRGFSSHLGWPFKKGGVMERVLTEREKYDLKTYLQEDITKLINKYVQTGREDYMDKADELQKRVEELS